MNRKCEDCEHQFVCRTYHDIWDAIDKNSDVIVWHDADLNCYTTQCRPIQGAEHIFEALALSCTMYSLKEKS